MTQEEINEIDRFYAEASRGSESSKLMWICCDVCRKSFQLPNETPCDHLMERIVNG
jgi:hypothetical protein